LVFDGTLVKNADDPAYANGDVIMLKNNAMMHLFSNINTNIQGKKLRVSSTMAKQQLGLLKFPDDFQNSTGLNQLWYKDNHTNAQLQNNPGFGVRQQYVIQKPDPKGTSSLRVPLKPSLGSVTIMKKSRLKIT